MNIDRSTIADQAYADNVASTNGLDSYNQSDSKVDKHHKKKKKNSKKHKHKKHRHSHSDSDDSQDDYKRSHRHSKRGRSRSPVESNRYRRTESPERYSRHRRDDREYRRERDRSTRRDDRLHLTVVEEIGMIEILEIIHQETKGEQIEQDQESDHHRLWMKEQDK
ncbi:unnamed protein product [Rhizopus microsporus]